MTAKDIQSAGENLSSVKPPEDPLCAQSNIRSTQQARCAILKFAQI